MVDAERDRTVAAKIGAIVLIIAAVQYVAAEAVTAAAWKDPQYSYGFNFISDLGVSSCGGAVLGRTICSPLHAVMNAGFIVQGVLFIVAALLLFRLLSGRLGPTYLVLAFVHGVGITLVGLVHGSPEAVADGSITWHSLGAGMAIIGGNLVSIMVGSHLLRNHGERLLGITEVALGTLGLISVLVLLTIMNGDNGQAGVFERGSVYSIMAAELIAGVALMSSRTRRDAAHLACQ